VLLTVLQKLSDLLTYYYYYFISKTFCSFIVWFVLCQTCSKRVFYIENERDDPEETKPEQRSTGCEKQHCATISLETEPATDDIGTSCVTGVDSRPAGAEESMDPASGTVKDVTDDSH